MVKNLSTSNRIKNLLFNISVTSHEVSSSSTLSLSSYDWILNINEDDTSKDRDLMMVDPLSEIKKSIECSVCENGCFFTASLVLTNIEDNINKFCILQLLKLKKKRKYLVYTRSGRVGYNRKRKFSEMFSCLNDAKEEFKKRFFDKTHNCWEERHSFLRKKNKYEMVETYFNTGNTVDMCFNPSLDNIISTLDQKFQNMLLLFYGRAETDDLKIVIQNWVLKFVATNIGVATAKQVVKALIALNDISSLLANRSKGKELVEACNNYYMKMPHATNYNAPKTILCAEAIEDEVLALQILAYAYLKEHEAQSVENPIKVYFEKFQWNVTHLDHGSPEFAVLQQSLSGLHGPTHVYNIDLLDAYKWHKQAEQDRFIDKGTKMLLWHGTQLSNLLGIIQYGLKMPPEDSQNTSSMFGRALYFADVSSKSANYCLPTKNNDIRFLLLCEVSMGTPLEVISRGDYSSHPSLCGGVLAVGEYCPSNFVESILVPDTLIPMGPLERRNRNDIELKYNEYVIYDDRYVKVKFLLKVKFSNL